MGVLQRVLTVSADAARQLTVGSGSSSNSGTNNSASGIRKDGSNNSGKEVGGGTSVYDSSCTTTTLEQRQMLLAELLKKRQGSSSIPLQRFSTPQILLCDVSWIVSDHPSTAVWCNERNALNQNRHNVTTTTTTGVDAP